MADDQEPLLLPETIMIRDTAAPFFAPNKTTKKNKQRRGLLPFVRLKSSRIIRALARSTARLRHRTKLAQYIAKFLQSSSKCKSNGKPHASSLSCSLIPFHPRRRNGHVPSHHHMNDPLLGNPAHCPHTNDGTSKCPHLNHSDTSRSTTRGNPALHPKPQFTSSNMEPPRKPDDHQHIKQLRMNGNLASIGADKGGLPRDVPKGCIGLYVGVDHTRFVVPIPYLNHPLFASLLECMAEVDGSFQPGPLWIPCNVAEFQTLQCHMKKLSKHSH